ncbi:relaxase/mobilization nuclease domain-containing protein [Coleofasciculus sp.]|uniref:relaxase/mobilization nuclease domain-containing protein n=1 Tax=Coleofasciculus sp. TaxID=3100458 RepID=UPI0040639C08
MLRKEKGELLESNMGGSNVEQLSREFGAIRSLRPGLKKACAHTILSIPHRDNEHKKGAYHEHLDNDQYGEVAHRWLEEMGYFDSQYVIARHHDTDHEHIHIIANRIKLDGSVVPDSYDYLRSQVVIRQLEQEFGLEPTPCSSEKVANAVRAKGIEATVTDKKALTQRQIHHESGNPTVKEQLQKKIDEASRDKPTMTQLIGRLQRQGVKVHPTFSTRGLFREAIAFEIDGVKIAGNKLGAAYSFPGLQKKRGVRYERDRDMPAIKKAADGELIPSLRRRKKPQLELD